MSCDLKAILTDFLKGAARIAVLGVGSELRGDDGVGVAAAAEVERRLPRGRDVKVFQGHTAPENLSGAIKEFAPSHIVAVDTAPMGRKPGEVSVIDVDQVKGVSFYTHSLPLEVLFSYLRDALPDLKVTIVGVEPGDMGFGKALSGDVSKAADWVAGEIVAALETLDFVKDSD